MKAVIIEDEELIARDLVEKLREVEPELEVLEILPSLKTARRWLMQNAEPDLFFMDIQLSDGVSFSIFEEFKLHCPVVFTTAYDEYAIRAFRVNGVDYLLKPVEADQLKAAVEKCRVIHQSRQPYPQAILDFLQQRNNLPSGNGFKQKFIAQARNQWIPVSTSDVMAFEKDNLFYIHTRQGEKHILNFESMEDIEQLLDPQQFYRANRQWIINIDTVKSVKQLDNLKLTVQLHYPASRQVDISREKAPLFKKWLDR
jgi:DNA-binding LytR/AlgR family response regulator